MPSGATKRWSFPISRPPATCCCRRIEASGGNDGYVSLEVAPRWAYDAARTVEEAQRLSAAVDRRNLLVKVPGTPEGVAHSKR